MLRLTKNELFIGFTISVILSLFANFTLLMRHYDLMMDSKVSVLMCETEKCNFWFSIFWFFFFSFILFIFYRWMYKWGNKFFRGKEVKIIGFAMGVVLFIAFGLYKIYPILHKLLMERICNITVPHPHKCTDGFISITEVSTKTLNIATDSIVTPEQIRLRISTIFSAADSYPLLIEHIFVLLIIMLSIFLLHLLDKKQEMKLEYEKIKVEKLQNSYNALMGQINPHFLYNTLSLINWKAIEADAQDISKITLALSTFYRTSLNKGKNVMSLSDELRNMRSYLDIQLMMHDYEFDVEFDVDESIGQYQSLNLMLQPLIENAIAHGIDVKTDGRGKLTITGKEDGDLIVLTVSDNGVGMSDEQAARILTEESKGYGVRNVNERIKLYYGEQYSLQIESKVGQGTKVSIRIPKRI